MCHLYSSPFLVCTGHNSVTVTCASVSVNACTHVQIRLNTFFYLLEVSYVPANTFISCNFLSVAYKHEAKNKNPQNVIWSESQSAEEVLTGGRGRGWSEALWQDQQIWPLVWEMMDWKMKFVMNFKMHVTNNQSVMQCYSHKCVCLCTCV